MSAVVHKSRSRVRKTPHLKSFDTTYLRTKGRRTNPADDRGGAPVGMEVDDSSFGLGGFEKFLQESIDEVRANPLRSPLEDKVALLFRRIESVTVHVIDRLGALALKGAAYIELKRG